MKKTAKKYSGVDWSLAAGILFWIILTVGFIALISAGQTRIPHPRLEITEASASRANLIIAHRDGDPVRFPNTRCIWTPNISNPDVIEDAGSLVMVGKERKEGRVSQLEPTEVAELEKGIHMQAGNVGSLSILDLKSGQKIFSQTVTVSQ
jgi:hypothetical protein